MAIQPCAEIILDSVSPYTGDRLTTMRVTMHRFILAEMNTHRAFSRNSASSRAIPVNRRIRQVEEDPARPVEWGRNRAGMVAGEPLDARDEEKAEYYWEQAARNAVEAARRLGEVGVHKQVVNRLLEPFLWHTVLVSATDWSNFFTLRLASDAQPEMRAAAVAMFEAYNASVPTRRSRHVPFGGEIETAVARCARVSYGRDDEDRGIGADREMFSRLLSSGHLSPFEHVAWASPGRHANYQGWYQLRTALEREEDWRSW